MKILVTGASGFIGSAIVRHLAGDPRLAPVAASRRPAGGTGAEERRIDDLGPATDWSGVLTGIGAVVHCAARAHQVHDRSSDPEAAFRRVNAEGTRRLAWQAAEQGVRRFVFLSSIKVNGEGTPRGELFTETDAPAPQDPYGRSKLEAELALAEIAAATGMEVVVFRLPLVYGPGVKGNLRRLLGWIARGVPVPLAAVDNRRSLLGLDNLAAAVTLALTHPAAAGRTYLLSDGEDISTPELVRTLAIAMDRRARLWPVPVPVLRAAGALTGRSGEVERLVGSLVVDSGPIRRELGWRPSQRPGDGLEAMARAWPD